MCINVVSITRSYNQWCFYLVHWTSTPYALNITFTSTLRILPKSQTFRREALNVISCTGFIFRRLVYCYEIIIS